MVLPSARQVLFGLNIFYIICGIIIIAVAAVAKGGAYVSNLTILGAVIATGVFMLLIGGFGLLGALKQIKSFLVIYMIFLGILFLVQFAVSIAALAIGNNGYDSMASTGWCKLKDSDKNDLQRDIGCYGFTTQVNVTGFSTDCMIPGTACPLNCYLPNIACNNLGTVDTTKMPVCPSCFSVLTDSIILNIRRGAGISLAFAFTELLGLAAAYVCYKGSFEALRVCLKLPIFDGRLIRAVAAEFVGMILFVYVGCSSVVGTFNPVSGGAKAQITDIALAFGLTIAALVHTIGHISGGHLNPAVTLALVLARKMKWFTGLLYMGAQCAGAIIGAGLTYASTRDKDVSQSCNTVPSGMGAGSAFLREFVLTFLLVFVVFGTIDPKRDRRSPGPLSIGLAVAVAHLASVTSTGTGINPARSLGPAVVQGSGCWVNHWVFWIGPLIGGAFAGIVYEWFFDFGDDKIISAKEAYTKEGRYEPESGRQTRQARDRAHNDELNNDVRDLDED
jgi:MIP family channel proteins